MSATAAAQPLSETVSEKPKLGRPERFNAEWLAFLCGLYPDIKTRRGILAKAYECTAVGCLHKDHVPVEGIERIFSGDTYAATILEQLGRLKCETNCPGEVIVRFARDLNAELVKDPAMTVRDAVETMQIVRAECRRIVENKGSQG
jgi:hypothetical protein